MRQEVNPMSLAQVTASFRAFSPQEKITFLVGFAHELTILARDTYEVGQDGVIHPVRLRRLNEVQHRLTSSLMAMLRQDPGLYPDEVLVRILLEHPNDAELQRQLEEAVARLMAQAPAAA
jgi:hypothetical protein